VKPLVSCVQSSQDWDASPRIRIGLPNLLLPKHVKGALVCRGANLKFGAFIMPALWPIGPDGPKHRCTFLGVLAPPPRLTALLGLVRAGLFVHTDKQRDLLRYPTRPEAGAHIGEESARVLRSQVGLGLSTTQALVQFHQ
jgi:hypothetical protein